MGSRHAPRTADDSEHAIALDVPVTVVLVAAGYLKEEETQIREIEVTRELTNAELATQVTARLQVLDRHDDPHVRSSWWN